MNTVFFRKPIASRSSNNVNVVKLSEVKNENVSVCNGSTIGINCNMMYHIDWRVYNLKCDLPDRLMVSVWL